eukprot:850867_1
MVHTVEINISKSTRGRHQDNPSIHPSFTTQQQLHVFNNLMFDGISHILYIRKFNNHQSFNINHTLSQTKKAMCDLIRRVTEYLRTQLKHEHHVPYPPTSTQWLQKYVIIPMANPEYTEEGATNTEEGAAHGQSEVVFESGEYHGYYEQYGASHAFPAFQLNFDATKKTVTGGGWEEVGK